MAIKLISCHAVFNECALVMSQKYNWTLETEFNPQSQDLYVVLGGHELAHTLLEVQIRKNMSFGYVILNSEQLHSQFFKNKYYLELMKRNIVCDYNSLTCEYLKATHNIKVFSFFFFEFMKFTLETEREYDIVFVGTPNDTRLDLYKQLKETYPNLNIFFDLDWKHSAPDTLTTLLHKAKVVLNMPYHKENALETHRINKALACGCQVISLPSCEQDANQFYEPYVHFTDDIVSYAGVYFKEPTFKKNYEELIQALTQKCTQHFLFVIQQIHLKLKSLSTTNEPASEVVSEPPTSDTNLPTCEETKDADGNSV